MLEAICLPFAASPNEPAYWISTFASGFTALTPSTKPTSNFLIKSPSTPPTKPTLSVFVVKPATTPAKKEPWCSLNVILATLGCSTTLSTIANFVSFCCWAISSTAGWSKYQIP